jgi:hypothetical protein
MTEYFHATEPENVPAILKEGLKPPTYLMNGRGTVVSIERAVSKQFARSQVYQGGQQVLLKVTLPADWPLVRDEASETDLFMKSLVLIPARYIVVDKKHWP